MSYPHPPDPWQHGGPQQPPPQRDDYGQVPNAPQHPSGGYGYAPHGVPQQPQQPPAPGWNQQGHGQWDQHHAAGAPQPPAPGWGQAPAAQPAWGANPYHEPRRPGTILGGAIMTYIGSGFMILMGLLLLIGSASTSFLAGAAEGAGAEGLATDNLRLLIMALSVYCLIVGIVLIILAVYAQRGRNGARIALTVIGVLQILLGVLSVLAGSPQTIVSIVYVGIAVVLFWVGGAGDWYRTRHSVR